jgi:anti-sigma B factor antagonist
MEGIPAATRLRKKAAGGNDPRAPYVDLSEYGLTISFQIRRFASVSARVKSRQVGEVTIIDLEGRITLGDGSNLMRDELRHLIGTNRKKILLNFAQVSYMDSSGMGQLVAGFTTVTNQGGQLKLLNLSQRTKDLLNMARIASIFEIYDDEASAIVAFA